jgi:hypothetical protein
LCTDSTIDASNGKLHKISKISKYLTYGENARSSYSFSYNEAKYTCESVGLSMAEIETDIDLDSLRGLITGLHLALYIKIIECRHPPKLLYFYIEHHAKESNEYKISADPHQSFWLGINDMMEEGHFVETDGTDIRFADFHMSYNNTVNNLYF